MITMQRGLSTDAAPEVVFGYLADFTMTELWDPGTVAAVRVSGDGGVGTRYENTSWFRLADDATTSSSVLMM